ncbi:MAG: glycosyltransferase family 39 protein [Proteobacteria bacterium]|nr:glycosyltransferase family 39 protein [Pseudomonadota bacterium]
MTDTVLPRPRGAAAPLAALLLLFAWFAWTAWARPLMLPDEGRYASVAWEMLRSGDWLTPTLDGLPFFHKPPLFYWITAGSLAAFGLHEWAARLASVLGATLGAWSLYLFARRWAGERIARASALVLATLPLFFLAGQFANLDMLVAGCIAAAVVAFADAVLAEREGLPYRRSLALAFLLAALGVLAKGLIGFVLPVLVGGIWILLLRRPRALLMMLWPPGLVLFALVAAPWFVVMQQRFPDFLYYFFVVQHFKRFAETGFNNAQPFFFYPVVLALASLPWFAWLWLARGRAHWADARRQPLRWLMAVWLVVIVGFFSLPQSKLVGYVLPAVPPLAFLIADAANARFASRAWTFSAVVAAALGLAVIATTSLGFDRSVRRLAAPLMAQRSAGEPIVFIDEYYYDLPFYARLREPVRVLEDWSDPAIPRRDNWRKELYDAGQFDRAAADRLLVPRVELPSLLCLEPVTWVLAQTDAAGRYPVLAHATVVATQRKTTLWRVERHAPGVSAVLDCRGTPNAG